MRFRYLAVSVVSLFILGGCNEIRKIDRTENIRTEKVENHNKKISKEEINEYIDEWINNGKIDVEKAKELGFLTLEERERVGYYTVETTSNKKVQKKVLSMEDEIRAAAQPVIEKNIDRKIEILGFTAPFPYDAYNIEYQTIDKPYVRSHITVGLNDSSYYKQDSYRDDLRIEEKEPKLGSILVKKTVEGIYLDVFEDEIMDLYNQILKEFPQYQGFPKGGQSEMGMANPFLKIKIEYITAATEINNQSKNAQMEIYNKYKQGELQVNQEWKKYLLQQPILFDVYINFIMKDLSAMPAKEMCHKLKDMLDNTDLVKQFGDQINVTAASLWTNFSSFDLNGPMYQEGTPIVQAPNALKENAKGGE